MSTVLTPPPMGSDVARKGWQEPDWLRPPGPRKPGPLGGPVMWWALVMLLALFSFYVYVLQEQVLRGEQARQALREAPARAAAAAKAAQSATAHVDQGGEAFDLMQLPSALQLRVGASR